MILGNNSDQPWLYDALTSVIPLNFLSFSQPILKGKKMHFMHINTKLLTISHSISTVVTLPAIKMHLKMSSAACKCLCQVLILAYRHTVWIQIRLLLEEQSDLGSHCLLRTFKKDKQMTWQTTFKCD